MNKKTALTRRGFLQRSGTMTAGVIGLCACGGFCGGARAAVSGAKFQLDGYCGDFCGACPNMVASEGATKHGDIKCYGCKLPRPNGKKPGCKIRACANCPSNRGAGG